MASKLSKLGMPKKRKEEEELDLSELDLGAEGEMAEESAAPEMEAEEGEMEAEMDADAEASPAADLSDDDLIAEMQKRGLIEELDAEMPESDEEDELA